MLVVLVRGGIVKREELGVRRDIIWDFDKHFGRAGGLLNITIVRV